MDERQRDTEYDVDNNREGELGREDGYSSEFRDYQQTWNLCKKCGRRVIDKSENPNSILCTECREEQIRYPIPKLYLLLGVLLLALVGLAFVRFPKALDYYKRYQSSEEMMMQGQVYDVLSGLLEVVEAYPKSIPLAVKLTDLAMESGNLEFAGYVIDTYLVGKEVKNDDYARIQNYIKRINQFYDTYDALAVMFEAVDANASPEVSADSLKSQLMSLLKDNTYDKALVFYYLSTLSTSMEESRDYLESSLDIDPVSYPDARTDLAVTLRRLGDLEGARKLYEQVLQSNVQDAGALRGMAILELLDGNTAEAVKLAGDALESYSEEPYVAETFIIALISDGQKEEAERVLKEHEAAGTVFDEDFRLFLDGSVDLQGYYIGE